MVLAWSMSCAMAPVPATSDTGSAPTDPPDHLLVLSIDTLRADFVDAELTPTLQGLLDDALHLAEHRSCGNWTYPSLVCALAGGMPVDVGFVPTVASSPPHLPSDVRLLAEELVTAGFQTRLVSTSPYLADRNGMSAGQQGVAQGGGMPASWVVDQALVMLDELEGAERQALHLHFLDPHQPYDPPDAYLGELEGLAPVDWDLHRAEAYHDLDHAWSDLDSDERQLLREHIDVRYRASLRYLDDQIARLLWELDERGLLDDTLVLLFSDHGEQFWDRGRLGHGKHPHREELAALGALVRPGVPAERWDQPTNHGDLAGLTKAALGIADAPELPDDRTVLAADYRELGSWVVARRDSRAVIYRWGGAWQAFDLQADPDEQDDLGEPRGDDWDALRTAAQTYAQQMADQYFPDGPQPGGR